MPSTSGTASPKISAREAFRADLDRYVEYGMSPSLRGRLAVMSLQAVWALAEHRFSHWVVTERPGGPFLVPLLVVSFVWHRIVEILTGISIDRGATIGPGLYIGHFGGIIVGPEVVMGRGCNIAQNITVGISGEGERRGSPVIGDDVRIGVGAVVFGKITIGDRVRIGANAVVNKDLPDDVLAVGVPAKIVTPSA